MKPVYTSLFILAVVNIVIILMVYYIVVNPEYSPIKYITQTLKPCCSCCCYPEPWSLHHVREVILFTSFTLLISLLIALVVFDAKYILSIVFEKKERASH